MELEEGTLGAPSALGGDECAAASIPHPHRALHGCRDMATSGPTLTAAATTATSTIATATIATATIALTMAVPVRSGARSLDQRELPAGHVGEQEVERLAEDRAQVTVRDLAPQ
jgi:hypothetical protein